MLETVVERDSSAGIPGRKNLIGRFVIEVRRDIDARLRYGMLIGSIVLGVVLSGAVLVLAGVPAANLINELVVATLFDASNLKSVLFQGAPLIFVGLAASAAFSVRFWNLGIEGQMIFGGIGATAVSLAQLGPESTRLPLMGLAAMVCGALWAAIPAALKLWLKVNEIITTLLLNYVAYNFLLHLLYGAWKDQDNFPHSVQYKPFELLPNLPGGVSSALLIAFVATAAATYVTSKSRASIYMRFVDANPTVAEAVGVPVKRLVFVTVIVSGALSALAGLVVVSGQEGRLTQSFFDGYGVSGVLVGFLARNRPLAAAIVALLMSVLIVAGQNLQVFYGMPQSMVQLIQALIVMCVAASDFLVFHRVHWVR
jgi:general nucleoside transport system permease protein